MVKSGSFPDEKVREKILEFAERGFANLTEAEKDEWFPKFPFWGVFHQRSGQESYFMMRIASVNGQLAPGQLRAIGEVARRGTGRRCRHLRHRHGATRLHLGGQNHRIGHHAVPQGHPL